MCLFQHRESKLLISTENIMLESHVCSPQPLPCPWVGKWPVLSLAHTMLLCDAQESCGGAAESMSAFKTRSTSRFIDSSTLLPSHQKTCSSSYDFQQNTDIHQCIHPLGIQLCLELPMTWGKSLTPSTSIVLSLFLVGICEHKGCGCSVSRSTLPHP